MDDLFAMYGDAWELHILIDRIMKCGLPLTAILISRVEEGKNDGFAGRTADVCILYTLQKRLMLGWFSSFLFFGTRQRELLLYFDYTFDIFCLQVSYDFVQLIGRYQVFECEVASTDLFRFLYLFINVFIGFVVVIHFDCSFQIKTVSKKIIWIKTAMCELNQSTANCLSRSWISSIARNETKSTHKKNNSNRNSLDKTRKRTVCITIQSIHMHRAHTLPKLVLVYCTRVTKTNTQETKGKKSSSCQWKLKMYFNRFNWSSCARNSQE